MQQEGGFSFEGAVSENLWIYFFKNTTISHLSINCLHCYHMQNILKKSQKPHLLKASTSSPGFPHVNQVHCGWGWISDTHSLCTSSSHCERATWTQYSEWLKSHEKPNPEVLSQVTPEFLTHRICEGCCDKPLRFGEICDTAIDYYGRLLASH